MPGPSLAAPHGPRCRDSSIDSGGFPGAAPQAQPAPQGSQGKASQANEAGKGRGGSKPKPQKSAAADPADDDKGARPGLSIAVLVNDEPITAYEIEQRAAFMALQGGGGGGDFKAKAEARWKAIIKDPKTQERFKELLRKNNVTTQEESAGLAGQVRQRSAAEHGRGLET